MSLYTYDLVKMVTRANPIKPARTERFVFEQPITPELRYELQRRPKETTDYLRRMAASELADAILEHCAFFHKDWFDVTDPDPRVRIELTVNDRGTYENMIPNERREAADQERVRTTKRLTESLPYGLAEAAQDFYE